MSPYAGAAEHCRHGHHVEQAVDACHLVGCKRHIGCPGIFTQSRQLASARYRHYPLPLAEHPCKCYLCRRGVVPLGKLANERQQFTVFVITFGLELRHRGTIVGRCVKLRRCRVTVGKQPVGKRRKCHKPYPQLFEHGEQRLVMPCHHRIAVLHGCYRANGTSLAYNRLGNFRNASCNIFPSRIKSCITPATSSTGTLASTRCCQ